MQTPSPELLAAIGNQLRILSIESTTAAGSGHPSSCCSAADLVAALFFGRMRFDPSDPKADGNDRFVLSKGHAAPLLYAAWEQAGHLHHDELLKVRKLGSPLQGHPTTDLDFVDVATGSLGQGLSVGVGQQLEARIDGLDFMSYVLLGDGELAEGSVWEAASFAGLCKLGHLVAIIDVNRYGQNSKTAFGHHAEVYQRRFEAFGWEAVVIDGHEIQAILAAYARAGAIEKPLAILAKTIKGKGIPEIEDKPHWHGKPLPPELAKSAVDRLRPLARSAFGMITPQKPRPGARKLVVAQPAPDLPYRIGERISARKAFGAALARLGGKYPELVTLDGDVGNSTYTDEFGKKFPDRFIEGYIAEQNMLGMAEGLASRGKIACVATFAAFLLRALDQIRMGAISRSNLKLAGTHAGVSIGEDGPSQMGLEDIAALRAIHGSTVLSPCDAVSTDRLTELMLEGHGLFYLRAARPETPVIYDPAETFEVGGAKILKQGPDDALTVIATGITVFEALQAHEILAREGIGITVIDAYCIKPLPRELLLRAIRRTSDLALTVEDHNIEGGLGDAVAGELSEHGARVAKLGVRELARSGTKEELLALCGIDAAAIASRAREFAARKAAA